MLLDCTMPGGDAFDVLPALRDAVPEARIVLVSGHDPADLQLASRSAGAVGYLTKETPARCLAAELDALVGLVGAVEQLLSEASQRFEQDAQSARAARRFVNQILTGWDDDGGDLTDTVTLLVSELVTNAVVHAGSEVEVSVRLSPTAARIEVTDDSTESINPRDATQEEDSGRGLALVGSLARRWGVRPAPGGGKTVWFEVDAPRRPMSEEAGPEEALEITRRAIERPRTERDRPRTPTPPPSDLMAELDPERLTIGVVDAARELTGARFGLYLAAGSERATSPSFGLTRRTSPRRPPSDGRRCWPAPCSPREPAAWTTSPSRPRARKRPGTTALA